MRWPHPIRRFRTQLADDVIEALSPIIYGATRRNADRVLADLAPLIAVLGEQIVKAQETILDAQRVVLAHLDGIRTQGDLLLRRQEGLEAGLETVASETVARVDEQAKATMDRVLSHPSYHTGAIVGSWMAGPGGEAVRYAVRKSAVDPGQTDNATRRKEALEWARRWLHEHGERVPPDSELNLMIEVAVLEMKYSRPVPARA